MENVQNISDISKETLTFLAFFESKMLEKIPSYIITNLCEEAADSKLDFYIDVNKKFGEQKISEKSKDLISLIYYNYIADEDEKKELLNRWNLNEKKFQEAQSEKYNYDNLFTKNMNTDDDKLLDVKKESLFEKIKNWVKKIFKK